MNVPSKLRDVFDNRRSIWFDLGAGAGFVGCVGRFSALSLFVPLCFLLWIFQVNSTFPQLNKNKSRGIRFCFVRLV